MQSTDPDYKIKLIVGLGNPGRKYANTPHNLGFLFIEHLRNFLHDEKGFNFSMENKKEYELTEFDGMDLRLLKPLLFMNLSGEALQKYLKYGNFKPEEILIVFDDLDIQFGKYKLQRGKFPKDHNGILSIQRITQQTGFNYLRIGAETRDEKEKALIKSEDYLLKNFSSGQKEIAADLFSEITSNILPLIL